MGPALNTAASMNALHPGRSRHLARRSRIAAISPILVEGDKRLFNQYGVMLVNPGEASEREEGAGPDSSSTG